MIFENMAFICYTAPNAFKLFVISENLVADATISSATVALQIAGNSASALCSTLGSVVRVAASVLTSPPIRFAHVCLFAPLTLASTPPREQTTHMLGIPAKVRGWGPRSAR